MALNKSVGSRRLVACVALPALFALAGCSVMGNRESPLNEVTKDSPSVLDIYRNRTPVSASAAAAATTARDRLVTTSKVRPIATGDEQTNRYWSALEPMQQRFSRVPNPDLVMVVFPHLANGR